MSLTDKLKLKALCDGKTFTNLFQNDQQDQQRQTLNRHQRIIPKQRYNFKFSIERREKIDWVCLIDPVATVSLALIQQHSPILEEYANKLPIMCMNVSRYTYTVEAFYFKNPQNKNCITESLEFYLRTDINNRNCEEPPNEQFSNFLHRLKSNGYEDYIFDLANSLNLNVDLIYEPRILYRFIRTTTTPIGYITAYCDNRNGSLRWYVKTTKYPLATER